MAENAGEIIKITETNLRYKIHKVRGVEVILDSDLAALYGYETKYLNRQVQRNIEKFEGEDFMFQLTENEVAKILRCKNCTSIPAASRCQNGTSISMQVDGTKGGRTYLPYAFTEQGIYMLMTVLKGELATKQSRALIRTFKAMKDYIIENNGLNQGYINNMVLEDHTRIDLLEDYFNAYAKKEKLNKIFFDGQIYDAYSILLDILNGAKEEIIIIDNYAGKKLLDIIKDIDKKVIIVSNKIDKTLQKKYQKQYKNVKFVYNNTIHDRFIIIDKKKLYSSGASFKDLGKKCFAINEMENEAELAELLAKIKENC